MLTCCFSRGHIKGQRKLVGFEGACGVHGRLSQPMAYSIFDRIVFISETFYISFPKRFFISFPKIITGSLVLCVMFCRSLFVIFLFAIVVSVLLRFTDSAHPFGIFKLFLSPIMHYPKALKLFYPHAYVNVLEEKKNQQK